LFDPIALAAAAERQTLAHVPDGAAPLVVAQALRATRPGARTLLIARDDARAATIADAVRFFAPEAAVRSLPAWDCLPYDRSSPALRTTAERLATLSFLAGPRPEQATLIVTTVNAVLQRVQPRATMAQVTRVVRTGERVDRDDLIAVLNRAGYHRVDMVVEAGEYAVRGGLLDVFPATEKTAMRLDFFGDELESIRRFDPADQRTIDKTRHFTLLPASEALLDDARIRRFRQGYIERFGALASSDPLYDSVSAGRRAAGMEHWLPLFEPALETVFDYLSSDDLVLLEAQALSAAANRLDAIEDYYQARKTALSDNQGAYRPLPPELLYLDQAELDSQLDSVRAHALTPVLPSAAATDCGFTPARDFAPERQAAPGKVYDATLQHLEDLGRRGTKRVIATYSEGARERFAGLLRDHGAANVALAESWQEALGHGHSGIALVVLGLEHGFTGPDVALLTEQDILGERLVRSRRRSKRADQFLTEASSLAPGDLVVHADHGIGRYEGLATIEVGHAPHDCVALTYADNAKLYVPVENIDVLSRYGSDSEDVALDRLGGAAWQARKARMKERIREIAHALMRVAAQRALQEAPALIPPDGEYQAFCARFPYTETDDQARAVEDVLADLGSGRPMDRLVCGDVGFGKTEVALRAACVAALAGQQVAVVCPTTLLARQHFHRFKERFSGLPLEVAQLSRLISTSEANRVREGLADGRIDIVVGTHAVLGKTISFKRLGLVVVDEEQHFGVAHKERLKSLRAEVHMLTLTATPIPRTLQMALTGLRDLSIIATPPVDRLAVRTYVAPWDDVVIREALLREHYRGGQSFLVTPRIADLPDLERFLREQAPEVRYVVAHGQMAPTELEERMNRFVSGEANVLLSTSIVESGLDIPTANTLIIHRADMFGLAQLYQLRGRVGRSKIRAYAHLCTPARFGISESAEKRLQVLASLDTLGAGFQLASHDMDQRGAGNLLGDEQSGHIREVGFELYQEMLEEAITAARAQSAGLAPPEDAFAPQITVGASVLIPEDYVPDLSLRMGLYRRIGDITERAEIDGLAAELIDRFGKLPDEVKNLLAVVEIKNHCRRAGVARLEAGPKGAVVTFREGGFVNVPALIGFLQKQAGTAKLRPDQKLVYARDWREVRQRLNGSLQLARALAALV